MADFVSRTFAAQQNKHPSRRHLLAGLGATAAATALAGCTTNPVTGRNQFLLVSDAQLTQMAAASWQQVRAKEGVVTDPVLNRRLTSVGQRIVYVSGLPRQGWEFTILNSSAVNAFVMPGGKVGFYKGILDLMENDDQIATVMGHEVAHVVGRHAAERYSQQVAAGLVTQVGVAAMGDNRNARQVAAIFGAGVTYGVLMPYSRAHELEADEIGLRYMHRAGYDPRQALIFWRRMASRNANRPPQFLSTHPDPTTRLRRMEQIIATL